MNMNKLEQKIQLLGGVDKLNSSTCLDILSKFVNDNKPDIKKINIEKEGYISAFDDNYRFTIVTSPKANNITCVSINFENNTLKNIWDQLDSLSVNTVGVHKCDVIIDNSLIHCIETNTVYLGLMIILKCDNKSIKCHKSKLIKDIANILFNNNNTLHNLMNYAVEDIKNIKFNDAA